MIQKAKTAVQDRLTVVREKAGNPATLRKIALWGLAGVAAIFGTKYTIKFFGKLKAKADKRKWEKEADTNPAVRQAIAIDQAVNPWGWDWTTSFDSTDVGTILRTAEEIKDLDAVYDAYEKITEGESLQDDLSTELSPAHYAIFMQMVLKEPGKIILNAGYHVTKDVYAKVKKESYLRTTPELRGVSEYNPFDNDNIIENLSIGDIIGITTGKQVWDYNNVALFAEITATTEEGKKVNVYYPRTKIGLVTKAAFQQKYKDKLIEIDPDDLD